MGKHKGDCVEIACKNTVSDGILFCYALVMGGGKLKGKRILHAWNELQGIVFDYSNGNKITTRKEHYYDCANIKEEDVVKQTSEEVRELLLEYQTYGGWIEIEEKP